MKKLAITVSILLVLGMVALALFTDPGNRSVWQWVVGWLGFVPPVGGLVWFIWTLVRLPASDWEASQSERVE